MTNEACPATILVVEDDEDIREAIGEILSHEGYDVALAENGEHALEVLGNLERPCLLLVDLIMPQMDGWDLMQALAKNDRLATIPVVVMSATAHPEKITNQTVVKKPIDLRIMLDIVRGHCCGEGSRGPRSTNNDRVTPVD
jgi:CheY-like chemotaxis protein